MKKILFFLALFMVGEISVFASTNSLAVINGRFYDSLEEAVLNASSEDTIKLTSNVQLKDTLNINKTINLDLNGRTVTAPSQVFLVQGGVLNVTGNGTIKESKPYYGAIVIKGSDDSLDDDYSIVNVGKDVTLEGWSGLFINHDSSKAYGVVVNLNGKINAVNDIDGGEGIGIYVNGNIQHQNNAPIINISDGAEISSTGSGLYVAGYSTFNIDNAYIEGVEAGIAIKSGNLNIDGAEIRCTGPDTTPTEGYNNGIKASGATIQIESNDGYAGNMKLNIKSGNLISNHGRVIYEYIGKGNQSRVNSIDISGGTLVSKENKNVFLFSNSFKNIHKNFISGGKYSSEPNEYLKLGYSSVLDSDLYKVIKNTSKEVYISNSITNKKNNFSKIIIGIIIGLGVVLIGFFNRNKIIKLFKTFSLII